MREKYLVLILVMLAATVAFVMLSGRSLDKNLLEVRSLDERIKTSQEQLNSARLLDQELSQFARIIENSLSKDNKFSFDEINDFKTTIGELAHQRRISIDKLSFSETFLSRCQGERRAREICIYQRIRVRHPDESDSQHRSFHSGSQAVCIQLSQGPLAAGEYYQG